MSDIIILKRFFVGIQPNFGFLITRFMWATLLTLACTASMVQAAVTISGDVAPIDPTTWSQFLYAPVYIGQFSQGELVIDSGTGIISLDGYVGDQAGSIGTVTITGAASYWKADAFTDLPGSVIYIGRFGSGTLNIQAGASVIADNEYIGFGSGSTGTVNISGADSTLTSTSLYVGGEGNGSLTVADGGLVSTIMLYASPRDLQGNGIINTLGAVLDADLIFNSTHSLNQALPFGSSGTLNLDMTKATVGHLGAGYKGIGTLNISEGKVVTSTDGYLGYQPGSVGTATVTGAGSKWICKGYLYVGRLGNGKLTVADGGVVTARAFFGSIDDLSGNGSVTASGAVMDYDFVFDQTHGNQKILNFDTGGTLTINPNYVLGCGYKGVGTIHIAEGKTVNTTSGYLGYFSAANGMATVTGTGSKWYNYSSLYIGNFGSGTLHVEAAGAVASNYCCYLGYASGSSGLATISGTNSKMDTNGTLFVGYEGNGILNTDAGGQVSANHIVLGYNADSQGSATITGSTTSWNTADVTVGYFGNGNLIVQAGGQVKNNVTFGLGNQLGSSGSAIVSGGGSKLNVRNFYLGYDGSGILDIGLDTDSGGLVMANNFKLASDSSGTGTCNINNGGALQAESISKGSGIANFNWNDGTIQNYNTNTNLTISNGLILKLASSGAHAFNIDLNRTGTVDAVLSDATNTGTLNKIGLGTLVLTAANTYSGTTTVETGLFKVTGSILNTIAITVKEAGILELAKSTDSATAESLAIDNAGMFLISNGSQKIGTIIGNGITHVIAGASLTAQSIVQDTLSIGGAGAGFTTMDKGSPMNMVPEPSIPTLLGLGGISLIVYTWRRRKA